MIYKQDFVEENGAASWRRIFFAAIAVLAIPASFFFDRSIQHWIATHQTGRLEFLMQRVSRFGDWPEHIALGLLLFAVAAWRGRRKWKRIFLAMLLACALAGVVAHAMKIAAGRARPSVQTEQGWNGPRLDSKHHSFPSGHAAASTAFFGALALANWRAGILLVWIPAVIGFARMYIGAHYFSDVATGAIVGILCALALWRMLVPVQPLESAAS